MQKAKHVKSEDKRKRMYSFEEFDGIIFEVLFNQEFSIKTLNAEEVKLIGEGEGWGTFTR
jgi:hypothetical protein